MYTTKQELGTHMNIENIDIITDNDDTIVESAIDGSISEAKGYLGGFDTDEIFSTTGANRNALLLTFVKDIAVWHLVVLSNYKADIELREKRYNRAVSWLKSVQKGEVTPDLPIAAVTEEKPAKIIYGSNLKRTQHF